MTATTCGQRTLTVVVVSLPGRVTLLAAVMPSIFSSSCLTAWPSRKDCRLAAMSCSRREHSTMISLVVHGRRRS